MKQEKIYKEREYRFQETISNDYKIIENQEQLIENHNKLIKFYKSALNKDKKDLVNEISSKEDELKKAYNFKLILADIIKKKNKIIKKQSKTNNYQLKKIKYYKTIITNNHISDEYINKCSICLENIDFISNKKTLECEHTFHKTCIMQLDNKKCPLCNCISSRF